MSGKSRSKRKGSLKETLSYALYKDDPAIFCVSYRDKDTIKTDSLKDFMEREDLADVPITRIVRIARDGKVVWTKGQKQVDVKATKMRR